MRQIALVAYESRFARCGGVTAVLNHLPGSIAKLSGAPTCVITPFHFHSRETATLKPRLLGSIHVPFAGEAAFVRVLQHDDRWPWIFLDAQGFVIPEPFRTAPADASFFAGRRHPYDVGETGGAQLGILRRDALFFGAAVVRALDVISPGADWTLFLQDWQAATVALAQTRRLPPVRCHLTLHNSYDSGGVWPDELARVGIQPSAVPGADGSPAATVLNRAFPQVRRPILTVSEQFALDFTEDVFQREVMANQLQHALRPPNVVGVNNGPFASLAIPEDALAAAHRHDSGPLRAWKASQKRAAMAALRSFTPTEDRPVWGDVPRFLAKADEGDTPWLILGGRDDARQKGYDVAAAALQQMLSDSGVGAQFLFFPMPGDEDRAGLGFLHDLAQAHPDHVLVLPFMFVEGYRAALQGAAFGVMPSLYEPFGMANEFYLNGAVGIGRATGGLLQQIVPVRTAPSFTPAVARRADRWHAPDAAPTGFLYREPDDLPNVVADWRAFNAVGYEVGGHPDRVEERSRYPLFNSMAMALHMTIADALAVYHASPDHADYFALLREGIAYTERALSWDKAATEYCRLLT